MHKTLQISNLAEHRLREKEKQKKKRKETKGQRQKEKQKETWDREKKALEEFQSCRVRKK